ncbi:MAG: hypothetical protein E7452_08670 [Ruminococcaceae bacterium]|nr:hypothetical protein [Oscillospiraceae bacterium]
MAKRMFRTLLPAALVAFLPCSAAVWLLRNLAKLLPSGGEPDFAQVFAQLADARITPHLLLPLLVFALFAFLLSRHPLTSRPRWARVLFWSAITVVCVLLSFAACLLLTHVNDIRFCDLLAALLPVLGAL